MSKTPLLMGLAIALGLHALNVVIVEEKYHFGNGHLAIAASVTAESRVLSDDPLFVMDRLLNDSDDLRFPREVDKRFWMKNQPSELKYERLNGAIGP